MVTSTQAKTGRKARAPQKGRLLAIFGSGQSSAHGHMVDAASSRVLQRKAHGRRLNHTRTLDRSSLFLMLTLIVTVVGDARAEPRVGGYVKSFVFHELTLPGEMDRAGSRLQLSVDGRSGPVSYFAAVDFEADSRLLTTDQPTSRGAGLDVYPVEMYLNYGRGPLELRIGQQFIFWGRTQWVNPTDLLTPWNYPDMASEIEDYRLAPLAARANWYIKDELMLDLVWLPLFTPHRIGTTGPSEMGGLPVVDSGSGLPERSLENGEFGIRLSNSFSSLALDMSICAYKGFEKLPSMSFEAHMVDSGDGSPPYPDSFIETRSYPSLTMGGLDFSKALGYVVLNAESAYLHSEDQTGDDPTIRNSRVESVAGLSLLVSENLDMGLQYVNTSLLSYDPDAESAALTQMMGTEPDFVEEAMAHSLTLWLNFKLSSRIGGQLTGVYNTTYRDYFALAFLSWEVADAFKTYAGVVGFGGENDGSPFGRQKENSRVFLEAKYSF